MSLVCERCGKGIMRGNNVSHAKNRTKKVWRPNLQAARMVVGGPSSLRSSGSSTRRVMLCTRCVKVLNRMKTKVEPRKAPAEQRGKQVVQVEQIEPNKKSGSQKAQKITEGTPNQSDKSDGTGQAKDTKGIEDKKRKTRKTKRAAGKKK